MNGYQTKMIKSYTSLISKQERQDEFALSIFFVPWNECFYVCLISFVMSLDFMPTNSLFITINIKFCFTLIYPVRGIAYRLNIQSAVVYSCSERLGAGSGKPCYKSEFFFFVKIQPMHF